MKTGKLHLTTALLTLLANSACTSAQVTDAPNQQEALRQEAPVTPVAKDTIPFGAECLIACYPQFVKGYKDNCLILSDGSTLVYDDGQQKTHTKISDISHNETAWQKYVDSGQMISFDMAFSMKAI